MKIPKATNEQLAKYASLPLMKHQIESKNNRETSSPDVEIRLKKYTERWVEDSLPESHRPKKEVFFFTNDMASCVSELVSHSPTEFIINGLEADHVKRVLFEYSYLAEQLPVIYRELILSTKAYMTVAEIVSTANTEGILKNFVFEVPKTEDVWEEINPINGLPKKIVVKQKKQLLDEEMDLKDIFVIRVFDIDGTTVAVTDSGGNVLQDYDVEYTPNPYKDLGLLQCLSFKAVVDSTGLPMASKLREYQLQVDNLDSNVQNIINLYGNPLIAIKKAIQDWSGMSFGAGCVVGLQQEEEIQVISAKAQLNEILLVYDQKVGSMYKSAGLLRMQDRKAVYASDSAKVTKLANSEIIGQIKRMLESARTTLDSLIAMTLKVGGKKYSNEVFQIPSDIMPIDLDSAFQTISMALNTKVLDFDEIYKLYFPNMQDVEKDRIRQFWKDQDLYALSLEKMSQEQNPKDTNTSTVAKIDPLKKTMDSKTVAKPLSQKEANKAENKEARGDAGKTTVS